MQRPHDDQRDPGSTPDRVWQETRDVGHLLRVLGLDLHRYVQVVARRVGVPPTDIHAVGVLQAADDPVSAATLSHTLGLTPSATSALIDRLGATGHAVRRVSPADARRAAIEATDEARAESSRHFEALTAAIHDALAAATPEDREAFARVLTAVVARMHDAADRLSRA